MPAIVTVEKAVAYPPRADGAMRKRVVLSPDRAACTNPILALVEDWMRPPGGFPEHPHRGLETATLVLGGRVEHVDSTGHRGVLGPGDVQWMTAGRGVLHSEMPHGDGEAHLLQLWINLPAAEKMCAPAYQEVGADRIPVVDHGSACVRVVAGSHCGERGPVRTVAPLTCLDVCLTPRGGGLTVPLACVRGIAYVFEGVAGIAGAAVATGEVAFLEVRGTVPIDIDATCGARLLVVAAPPMCEPMVARGPFVMSTEAQIAEAIDDLRRGSFVG